MIYRHHGFWSDHRNLFSCILFSGSLNLMEAILCFDLRKKLKAGLRQLVKLSEFFHLKVWGRKIPKALFHFVFHPKHSHFLHIIFLSFFPEWRHPTNNMKRCDFLYPWFCFHFFLFFSVVRFILERGIFAKERGSGKIVFVLLETSQLLPVNHVISRLCS